MTPNLKYYIIFYWHLIGYSIQAHFYNGSHAVFSHIPSTLYKQVLSWSLKLWVVVFENSLKSQLWVLFGLRTATHYQEK